MGQGVPLTDYDRWDWLTAVARSSAAAAATAASAALGGVAVGTCSALKQTYRDHIRDQLAALPCEDKSAAGKSKVVFVFLVASQETLEARCRARQGHFMGAEMVKSQLAIMQVPEGAEVLGNGGDCTVVGEEQQQDLDAMVQGLVQELRLRSLI